MVFLGLFLNQFSQQKWKGGSHGQPQEEEEGHQSAGCLAVPAPHQPVETETVKGQASKQTGTWQNFKFAFGHFDCGLFSCCAAGGAQGFHKDCTTPFANTFPKTGKIRI